MSASSAMQDLPVSRAEFAGLMSKIEAPEDEALAVAVSGGADSLALLVLLARSRCSLFALSVDHGLRKEAAYEARHVARVARRLGVPHVILRHRGQPPRNQAAARDIRFDLLASWCRRNRVKYCALGHHRADQAETFLFRLARGSGIDGLAAMPTARIHSHCHFIRPLLGVSRGRLRAVLTQAGISWREDPSNRDPAYSRTHLGRALDILAAQGLSAKRLARASEGAARLKSILSQKREDFLHQHVEFVSSGYCWLARDAFYALPQPLRHRVLGHILQGIGGRIFRPSEAQLAQLYEGLGGGRTLAGCRIIPRGSCWLIFREFADIGPPVSLKGGASSVWDRRFRVRLGSAAGYGTTSRSTKFEVAPLGFIHAQALKREVKTEIPPLVRPSLPALWHQDHLVSVPHLGFAPTRLEVSPF